MKAKWNRISLSDCILLVAAYAIGMRMSYGGDALIEVITRYFIMGGIVAGPLILTSQAIRGRRVPLSFGEWLWLAPPLLYLGIFAVAIVAGPSFTLPRLGMVLLILIGVAAACRLIDVTIAAPRKAPPCRWTDMFGSAVSATMGLHLFWWWIEHPEGQL